MGLRGAGIRAEGGRIELVRREHAWVGTFDAMASPCEVHVAGADLATAAHVARAVAAEAWRIERKFSRYRSDNVVARINGAQGAIVRVDDETARLLTYAAKLHELSEGRFDVTSGVLRKVWRFDGSDRVPSAAAVREVLARVGWDRVRFEPPELTLEPGMEIDFGGIGKEYAVDSAARLVKPLWPHCLINFGGDLCAVDAAAGGAPWIVGIERPDEARVGGPRIERPDEADGVGQRIETDAVARRIELGIGALATSGDSRRFLLRDGKRYGHVLDARTGWPVEGAPRSVTVAAPTCTEAGMLATFALLHGAEAEAFLGAQGVRYWCRR
ncbi:MAG TPA: FAD:protein FMN transferase [Gammaproteobacteria bacterium]|nr:FAD:protein FMN transferase [Gammaproteobacteria bacterium]